MLNWHFKNKILEEQLMLGHSIFSPAKPEINPLLRSPEELTREAGDAIFEAMIARRGGSFCDGVFPFHPRKILLLMDWATGTFYRKVQYMDLPDEFTEYERSLFVKKTIIINGKETEIYEHERGREPGLFEERITKMQSMAENTAEENERRRYFKQIVRAGSPQQSSITDCADFISQNKVLLYVGAGISAGTLPTNQAVFEAANYTPHASYDPFIKTLLNNPEQLIEKGFMFDWSTHLTNNPLPSPAHHAVIELAQLLGCQITTSNSDPYLQKGKFPPYSVWNEDFRKDWDSETAKKITAIITIGCGDDAVGFLGMYSDYNPEGRIIALNLESPAYLGKNDLLVEGDVQETLPALLKLIKLSRQDAPEPASAAHP